MKYLPLLWGNLHRRRLRTALTLLSIVVAFVLYGYLSAIRRGLDQGVTLAGADRLFVRHRVSITQPLPISYYGRMVRLPGVAAVVHASWFGGVYQDPKNFFAQMAVEPEAYFRMYPEMDLAPEAMARWLATRNGAVVGRKTAERFGWKVGDRIPIQATIWLRKDGNPGWDFELVGIYEGREEGADLTNFFFRYDYFDEGRAFGEGLIGWYIVQVEDPERAGEIAAAVDAEFANSPNETKAETEGAFLRGWARQVGDITTIVVSILGAVFFTILLVTGNTMAQSVRERTEELGVLKAMGFSNGQVLLLVLGESCFMSLLGGGCGLGLAWLLISAGDPTRGALPVFIFPAREIVMGVGLAFALGLVAGIFPALQAMRLRIAEALRRM